MKKPKLETLVIIAAGNSSRMGQLPKAVSLVGGVPNLYNTVRGARRYFSKIYIASNEANRNLYEEVLMDFSNVEVHAIKSGQGCGDAIWKVLTDKRFDLSDESILCWGDTYFPDDKIFKEMIDGKSLGSDGSPLLIGCKLETEPYAWFDFDFDSPAIKAVRFRKRGEKCDDKGWHDQSIFKVKVPEMRKHLTSIRNATYRDGSYITGEMVFLDSCFYLFLVNRPAEIVTLNSQSYSYNTQEELQEINKLLKSTIKN